jgi:hypothetical protein
MALELRENFTFRVYSSRDLLPLRAQDGRLRYALPEDAPALLRPRPIREFRAANKVARSGVDLLIDLLNRPILGSNQAGRGVDYLAVGTGTTPPDFDDLTLQAEVFRKQITRRLPGDQLLTYKLFLDTLEANENTLTEAGLFNVGSGGSMFNRVVHLPINKDESVAVVYQCVLTITVT